MAKIIYAGLEDSGKSLMLARQAKELLYRNSNWYQKTGVKRPILSNLHFSSSFENEAESRNVPVQYWSDLSQVVGKEDCDLFMDEIGTFFDSRLWADLNLDTRRWLAQASKLGVDIYGTAQDFAQVDKSFRRLTNQLYEVRKLIGSRRPSKSKPAVKRIWGICVTQQIDPVSYSEDEKKYISPIPFPFLISIKDCQIFDTRQLQVRTKYIPMEHVIKKCADCGDEKVVHR